MKISARTISAGFLALGLSVGFALPASATTSSAAVVNGDFESDPVGTTDVTSWTVLDELVDLGVTEIAGCLTVDTSDYTTLRDFELEAFFDFIVDDDTGVDSIYYIDHPVDGALFLDSIESKRLVYDYDTELFGYEVYDEDGSTGVFVFENAWGASDDTDLQAIFDELDLPDPTVRQDNVSSIDNFFSTTELYDVKVVDSDSSRYFGATGGPLGNDTKVLEMFSNLRTELATGGYGGYVSHGAAVYSEPFTVPAGRQISLDWFAAGVRDDFHVFGYLLNTDTCEQTEVLDATGEESAWSTSSVAIPAAGSYRFVFVSGTFDKTFGLGAGALLYIDNIVQSVAFAGPGVDLALSAVVGDYLPGSAVDIAGGNLQPNSDYELILQSTPVTVTSGVADSLGAFSSTVNLPTNITPGQHTLTLRGIAPGGAVLTDIAYVTVGSDGRLLYLSFTGPQGLPDTGLEAYSMGVVGLGVLVLGCALLAAGKTRVRQGGAR